MTNHPTGLGEYETWELLAELKLRGIRIPVQILTSVEEIEVKR